MFLPLPPDCHRPAITNRSPRARVLRHILQAVGYPKRTLQPGPQGEAGGDGSLRLLPPAGRTNRPPERRGGPPFRGRLGFCAAEECRPHGGSDGSQGHLEPAEDRLPHEGESADGGACDPRAVEGREHLPEDPRGAEGGTLLSPPRRPPLREWPHPHRPRREQGPEGPRGPQPYDARPR